MKLITETRFEDVRTLSEGEGDNKKLYIEGVFLMAEVQNKNGRRYPKSMLEQEVDRYTRERINTNRAYGELEHPATPVISLKNVSHRIVSLKEDKNNWVGKAIISPEGNGRIVRGLIEMGSNLGVSSRGTGSLKAVQGINEVQNDFRLSTAADIVTDPSAPDAFVNGIMESVDWTWDERNGWQALQIAEGVKRSLDRSVNSLTESERLHAFKKFVDAVQMVDFNS